MRLIQTTARALSISVSTLTLGLALALLAATPSMAEPIEHYNLKNGLVLKGYDPVSYFDNVGPQPGNKAIQTTHEGVTYYFVSQTNKETFLANPAQYKPAYGAWCAYAMLKGKKVNTDPESYKIIDGHNYVFYNTVFANARKKWNELAEKQGDQSLVKSSDANWTKIIASD